MDVLVQFRQQRDIDLDRRRQDDDVGFGEDDEIVGGDVDRVHAHRGLEDVAEAVHTATPEVPARHVQRVRTAAADLVEAAKYFLGQFSPVTEYPLPGEGRARFYVRAGETVLHAEASENELGEERHPLSKLFYAGHKVITELRVLADSAPLEFSR